MKVMLNFTMQRTSSLVSGANVGFFVDGTRVVGAAGVDDGVGEEVDADKDEVLLDFDWEGAIDEVFAEGVM